MFTLSVVCFNGSAAEEIAREDFFCDDFNPRRVVDFLDLMHIEVCLPITGSTPTMIRNSLGRFSIDDCYVCIHDFSSRESVEDFPLVGIMFKRDIFASFLDMIHRLFIARYDGALGGDLDD